MKTPGIFEEIKIAWKGRDYSIPPNRVLQCIAKVEDIITLTDLHRFSMSQSTPFGKLAMAFGAVLRHAGARVTDDEVHLAMFQNQDESTGTALQAVQMLLLMMIPPGARKKAMDVAAGADAGEETEAQQQEVKPQAG